ncbi:hypothetical protein EON65_07695 [archaeon]|nr:MAG: hypothetical protein EON65_07695 [archaeon]
MSKFTVLPDNLLPQVFQHLLVYYDIIDQAYNFLSKAKMKCSITNLASMYSSLVQVTELNEISAWKLFSPFPLCYLISYICPDEFRLVNAHCTIVSIPSDMVDSQALSALELSFKTLQGMSKQVTKQRRRKVIEGLWDVVEKQFIHMHSKNNDSHNNLHDSILICYSMLLIIPPLECQINPP